MHKKHLDTKHKSLQKYLKKNSKEFHKQHSMETHEHIIKRVKKVGKLDYKILKKNRGNPSVGEMNGEKYDVAIFEKEYGPMEHD